MEIDGTTSSTSVQSASTVASQTLGSDFETFLNLLTAQVENQDPLSPLDSTQFVEQLATFSALEQQVATNSHLESITSLIQASLGDESVALLGQQATATQLTVTEGQFSALPITASGVTVGTLNVLSESGEIVFQGTLDTSWSWDGTTSTGEDVPDGTYRFEVVDVDGNVTTGLANGTVDRVLDTDSGLAVGFATGVSSTSYQV